MCIPDIAARQAPIRLAALQDRASDAPLALTALSRTPLRLAQKLDAEVKITFVGHSTFLIESPGGVSIATDYNDYVKPAALPMVVTMNKAHTTHFTPFPDPGIKHVLRGWNPAGGPARHDIQIGDVRVRNVVTNIRNWGGETELYGNSIFVFEVAGLCIAHLGHLHHTLTAVHFKQMGRIDVLLVPVDGGYTLDLEGMSEVVQKLYSRLAIPMHYFGSSTLQRFLTAMEGKFPIERSESPQIVVSRQTLMAHKPKIVVLPGRFR
jgi:L-ascorbate metabolism protein UlaG (beta-lactamase superfamily)